jgi:hypothetical protein
MQAFVRGAARVVAGAVICTALSAAAFSGRAMAQLPDKFTNLKVLPADISKAELVETMKSFTRALGVRCTACHVGEEGKPLTTYDFPSDEKRMKQNARIMLLMLRDINQKSVARVQLEGEAKPVTVTCYTCHRGQKQPETKAAAPATPPVPPVAAQPPK